MGVDVFMPTRRRCSSDGAAENRFVLISLTSGICQMPAFGEFQNNAELNVDEFTLILSNDYLI
jgi:hypothetical protein